MKSIKYKIWYRKMMFIVFLLKMFERKEKRLKKYKQKVLDWKDRVCKNDMKRNDK